jgi:hypothetical protein
LPILVTVCGITIFGRVEHPKKAFSPIDVIFSPNDAVVITEQFWKAQSSRAPSKERLAFLTKRLS